MYLNYPNNPTGAIAPDGLFEQAVEFARAHDILVVHDASYTETTFDGYVAPSFLAAPGAKEGEKLGIQAADVRLQVAWRERWLAHLGTGI